MTKPQNLNEIQKSFNIQASLFEDKKHGFSDRNYLKQIIKAANPKPTDSILEVASGTCICGRALAPLVKNVTCVDATQTMLDIGKKAAHDAHLLNMSFTNGYAENLAFKNDNFDIVISRLAFHHFSDTVVTFKEMARVLKPNGKLVIVDMIANENSSQIQNQIEKMRDNSHTKALTKAEMDSLFISNNFKIDKFYKLTVTKNLNNWLSLTNTSENEKEKIIKLLQSDIANKIKTGFFPYIKNNEIYFKHTWGIWVGSMDI